MRGYSVAQMFSWKCWPSLLTIQPPPFHSHWFPGAYAMHKVDTNVLSFNLTLGSTASAGHWKLCMTLLEVPGREVDLFFIAWQGKLLDRKLHKNPIIHCWFIG